MKVKPYQVKIAVKLMSKKKIKILSELSEKEFYDKIRNHPKTKDFTDDIMKMMREMVMKKAKKF